MKPAWRILAVAALCIAALIALVVRESAARNAGQEVLLSMEAVDPRALLSGHYVIVTLAESLPDDQDCLGAPPTYEPGEEPPPDRWLALTMDGAVHRIAGAAPTREEALSLGSLAVKGTTFCSPAIRAADNTLIQPATYRSDVGIDRFHVSQTEAERIENALSEQNIGDDARVYAIASVGQDGNARLKGLMVDGERLELGWN